MKHLLQVEDLCKVYLDGTKALHPIRFDVGQGEFAVIIGPSGAGKSTLLRSINRLVEPSSGTILFKGHKKYDSPPSIIVCD